MGDPPVFEDFYRAVNAGRSPFPWQARLAGRLRHGEGWPTEIGVPTGLGKTSCADIAIWWLAHEADRPPPQRAAPTRIWWVVNRRLLVDATTAHVEHLARLLADPDGAPGRESRRLDRAEQAALVTVAERLRGLSARPDAPPLEVVRLRGGVAGGRPTDPSQPAVILSTIPMYASRLLFRGYGVSRSMRPVDAALAGTDSLVLVDEAHLARHLIRLFGPLSDCDPAETPPLPPGRARPHVVSLTATGAPGADRFDLDAEDQTHPTVRARLDAAKPVRLDEHPAKTDPAQALADAAAELLAGPSGPASCVVFANTPAVARDTFAKITALTARHRVDAEIVLLTGRSRERETAATRARILDPAAGAPAGRPDQTRDRHFVVVATQTLEVGADLDFDLLVTEACGVRALTQRLGRLNRLGRQPAAAARYIHIPPPARAGEPPAWPVYGAEPTVVADRLRGHATDGTVDLSPARVADVLGPPGDDPGRAPELLPAILAEWAKTSRPPDGEAPVEPFFAGLERPELTVSVAWRAYLPAPGEGLWPRLGDDEVIDLPLGELRDATAGLGLLHRLGDDRATVEAVPAGGLRPGDTILLPSDAGLADRYGWDPTAAAPVVDVSVLRDGLPLDPDAIRRISGISASALINDIVEPSDDDDTPVAERVENLLGRLAAAEPPGITPAEWADLLAGLARRPDTPAGEIARLSRGRGREPLVDELDELSLLTHAAVDLAGHGRGVGGRAEAVARQVGLAADVVAVAAQAGRFHDTGKADRRFQQWLDPHGQAGGPVAKSRRPRAAWARDRIAAGWPAGGRHEALSGRLVHAWLEQSDDRPDGPLADLLIHLVVAHHGWGRPLLPPVADDLGGQVLSDLDGLDVKATADLSIVDWDQPGRFRRLGQRYGHWGLALLEAVVRQSDHAVSAGGWAGASEVV